MRADLADDYAAFGSFAQSVLTSLRETGLDVQVYMDGPEKQFKALTEAKRLEQRRASWVAMYGWCLDGSTSVENGQTVPFPSPQLLVYQLRATLEELAIPVVQCRGEADAFLAMACAADTTERSFVVGDDSDYLVMRGCR